MLEILLYDCANLEQAAEKQSCVALPPMALGNITVTHICTYAMAFSCLP